MPDCVSNENVLTNFISNVCRCACGRGGSGGATNLDGRSGVGRKGEARCSCGRGGSGGAADPVGRTGVCRTGESLVVRVSLDILSSNKS